jgi:hypothetical protein
MKRGTLRLKKKIGAKKKSFDDNYPCMKLSALWKSFGNGKNIRL